MRWRKRKRWRITRGHRELSGAMDIRYNRIGSSKENKIKRNIGWV